MLTTHGEIKMQLHGKKIKGNTEEMLEKVEFEAGTGIKLLYP
jgi:hypothetical protein